MLNTGAESPPVRVRRVCSPASMAEQPRCGIFASPFAKGPVDPGPTPHAIEKPRKSGYALAPEGDDMARHLVILMAILLSLAAAPAGAAEPSLKLKALIEATAAQYQLPSALLNKIIKRESNYNPSALFRGHWGLMQIKYATAKSDGLPRATPRACSMPRPISNMAASIWQAPYLVAGGNAERAGAPLSQRLLLRGQAQGIARGNGPQSEEEEIAPLRRSLVIALA